MTYFRNKNKDKAERIKADNIMVSDAVEKLLNYILVPESKKDEVSRLVGMISHRVTEIDQLASEIG